MNTCVPRAKHSELWQDVPRMRVDETTHMKKAWENATLVVFFSTKLIDTEGMTLEALTRSKTVAEFDMYIRRGYHLGSCTPHSFQTTLKSRGQPIST